jgi:cytochrome c-type biogenesis protein CcmH
VRWRAILAALAGVLCIAGSASDPAERLPDPAQEARARAIFEDVRCLVCQNESIDDSEAELAGDLRRIVREQVRQGRSDAEIKRFLTDRYGEFVLLTPAFNAATWRSGAGPSWPPRWVSSCCCADCGTDPTAKPLSKSCRLKRRRVWNGCRKAIPPDMIAPNIRRIAERRVT